TCWPDGEALGQRISVDNHPGPEDWLTVIGVVGDVKQESLTENVHPAIYQPYSQVRDQSFLSDMTFAVPTAAPPASMATALRAVLREVDRNQAPQSIAAMTDLVSTTTAEP